jgi:predicted phosphodiesterase
MDAGDLLEVLIHAGVDVVLSGHKHVPYVWRLEDLYVANAGTVSSMRVRGHGKPCYNVLEFDGAEVRITRRFPFDAEAHLLAAFVPAGERHPREEPFEHAAADHA